jgi:hypothetical protein
MYTPASDQSHYKSVWDVPTKTLAEQMTLMDWFLFRDIPLSEFLANGWDRPRCGRVLSKARGLYALYFGLRMLCRYEHSSDCIMRFIDRVNAICLWVESAVLQVGIYRGDLCDVLG